MEKRLNLIPKNLSESNTRLPLSLQHKEVVLNTSLTIILTGLCSRTYAEPHLEAGRFLSHSSRKIEWKSPTLCSCAEARNAGQLPPHVDNRKRGRPSAKQK